MPNGNKDYEEWKVSSAEFRGFMKANITSIKEHIEKLDEKTESNSKRIGKLDNRMTATEIKGGIFGSVGGIIGGLLSGFFKGGGL